MELALFIYLIDTFGNKGAPAGLGGIIAVVYIFITLAPDTDVQRAVRPLRYIVIPLCTILILIGALFPSKETAYKMLAAYGVTEVVKSEIVGKYADGSLKVLDKAMTEYLGEDWDKD